MKKYFGAVTLSLSFALAGCGGGGGGGSNQPLPGGGSTAPPSNATSDFDQGIFRDSDIYKDFCENPRAGNGFADLQGTTTDENDWLRAWSNELYLWYDEIIDEDPAAFETLPYFDLMRTFATTASGADRDRFHFTFDTEEYQQLSQSGITAGYGAEISVEIPTPPRELIIAFVEPGSPAESKGLMRGDRILRTDGVDAVNGSTQADVDTINAALFPASSGETHTLVVQNVNSNAERTVNVTSQEITVDPVPDVGVINTAAGPVGYLHFTTHIATAEAELIDAITTLANDNITELVLDLRYNGGGFLDIANELAFMIAGPAAAQGRVFDEITFSDKHPTTNPVTGAALAPDFFHTTSQGFSVSSGQNLPSLNLPRVFVLSGPGTCSASEAIINGLRGIDVEVILIGEPTCGKPYGFFPFDNCGTTYFTIQFSGSNNKGFGDYPDGFIPVDNDNPSDPTNVTGCPVADDFANPLGNVDEARLAAALEFIETGDCPSTSSLPTAKKSLPTTKSLSATSPSAIAPGGLRMPGRVKQR